ADEEKGGGAERRRVDEGIVRVLGDWPQNDGLESRGNGITGEAGRRRWLLVDVREQDVVRTPELVERTAPGDERVKQDSSRVDVGALVDGVAAGLFGRGVAGGSDAMAVHRGECQRLDESAGPARDFCDAEIEELDSRWSPFGSRDEDVVRLDVAMDDAGAVHGPERRKKLPREVD